MMHTQGNLFSQPSASVLMDEIRILVSENRLETSDLAFADFFFRRYGEASAPLISAVIWLSYALRQGHTSLNLNTFSQNPEEFKGSEAFDILLESIPTFHNWEDQLMAFDAVGNATSPKNEPLILENGYLYFRRFFVYESEMASRIKQRAELPFELTADKGLVKKRLHEWFDDGKGGIWQKLACLNALGRKFTVITGGPGTGKTHTVLRLMAMLLEADLDGRESIALAAPTGKAAARVGESILNGLSGLHLPESIKQRLPVKAQTIHRLLGYRYQSSKFKYNRDNPLPYSVIIIDEASMIDLTLMTKLLEAVDDDAKLILLGDKDQLASVEAGSVFADICAGAESHSSGVEFASVAKEMGIELPVGEGKRAHPLQECIVQLQESRRFGTDSGIGKLARAINQGKADEALQLLASDEHQEEISFIPLSKNALDELIRHHSSQQFKKYTDDSLSQSKKLSAMTEIQFLCAHKKGDYSVQAINQKAEVILGARTTRSEWYHGRPVIMMENDYQINVYNGDTALCQVDDQGNFSIIMESYDDRSGTKSVRSIPIVRLQQPETSWALSVHKSQGSEYDTVVVVLPEKISPVVTRELLYTGITRAKKKVILMGTESVIKKAIEQKTKRFGGLRQKLWGEM